MPITIRCPIHDIETEFEDEDAAVDAGWYQSAEDREWYSPEAIRHGGFCEICDEYLDYDHDDYYCNIDGDDGVYCEDCFNDHGGYWCPKCESNHWNENVRETEIVIFENGHSRVEYWCQECADELADWNEDDQQYEYYRPGERMRNEEQEEIHRNPEGTKPEICAQCIDYGYIGQGECKKCLLNRAYNKELKETTAWVYDTRFFPTGWYHPQDHTAFKSTFYRCKDENPYLYYGIESEVKFNKQKTQSELQEIAKTFIELTGGLAVAESDSSVPNGIEFIFRPMSYKKITSPEVINALRVAYDYLHKQGADVDQPKSNGIHIHMSRRFFERNTQKDITEINKDLDWVFQYYQPEIEVIAQREYTSFCESKLDQIKRNMQNTIDYRISFLPVKLAVVAELGKSELQNGRDFHHSVITMRDKTVEVRCFKSTLNVDTIISYIEFVRNIAHTVRNKNIKNMTFEEILSSKDSPRLDTYIYNLKRHKGLKTDRKVKDKMKKEFDHNELRVTNPF